MFGSGKFGKREAFSAVGSQKEPFPIYVEIFLPTVAHHLGFRVRDYGAQDKFVGVLKDKTNEIARAQKNGAWAFVSGEVSLGAMMRRLARSLVLGIARIFGTKIVDCSTGRSLGKALFIPWRGKIHIIGLNEAVRATFFPQNG